MKLAFKAPQKTTEEKPAHLEIKGHGNGNWRNLGQVNNMYRPIYIEAYV